jgi:hypothetical protein
VLIREVVHPEAIPDHYNLPKNVSKGNRIWSMENSKSQISKKHENSLEKVKESFREREYDSVDAENMLPPSRRMKTNKEQKEFSRKLQFDEYVQDSDRLEVPEQQRLPMGSRSEQKEKVRKPTTLKSLSKIPGDIPDVNSV